jgi:hypothetical protein
VKVERSEKKAPDGFPRRGLSWFGVVTPRSYRG